MHGRGHAWQGHAWQGLCMTGGVHVREACMAGGAYGMGACIRVHSRGACMAGEEVTAADSTHPTGMHSGCLNVF